MSRAMTYAIETHGLTRRFGRTEAVTDLARGRQRADRVDPHPQPADRRDNATTGRWTADGRGDPTHRAQPDRLRADDQVTVAATLPLQVGATYHGSRRRLILDQIVSQSRAATIRLRHFTSTSMFESELRPQLLFYLRNRGTSEAVAGSSHGMLGVGTGIGMPMLFGVSGYSHEPGSGFSVMSEVVRFPAAYGGYPGAAPPIDITPGMALAGGARWSCT